MAGRLGEDAALRLGGAAMLALAEGAADWLFALARSGVAHGSTLGEAALATIAFLGLTGGAMLLVLGRHVGDRVLVAERWRQAGRPMVLPPPDK